MKCIPCYVYDQRVCMNIVMTLVFWFVAYVLHNWDWSCNVKLD